MFSFVFFLCSVFPVTFTTHCYQQPQLTSMLNPSSLSQCEASSVLREQVNELSEAVCKLRISENWVRPRALL